MYPNELGQFIRESNYQLEGCDLLKATSLEENPQLNHILFNPYENKYKMWDKEGNYYEFTPIPCKTLTKKR